MPGGWGDPPVVTLEPADPVMPAMWGDDAVVTWQPQGLGPNITSLPLDEPVISSCPPVMGGEPRLSICPEWPASALAIEELLPSAAILSSVSTASAPPAAALPMVNQPSWGHGELVLAFETHVVM
jgi:hypothetical protein